MSYDIEAVRRDFPILQVERRPGVPLVYLDNGASSQKPDSVIDSISNYYRHTHSNVHRGIHMLSEAATEAYENARKKVQRFINAGSRREIVFTRGTTESINLVAQSWGRANLKPGDVVLSTVMEHHANIVPWQILAQERGFTLRYLSVLPDGTLDMAEYESLLESQPVKLVLVTQCSNVLANACNPKGRFSSRPICVPCPFEGNRLIVSRAATYWSICLILRMGCENLRGFSGRVASFCFWLLKTRFQDFSQVTHGNAGLSIATN